MKYRTDKQFLAICDSMINGNWSHAGKECATFGFYANDLKLKYEEIGEQCGIDDIWDFVELIALAEDYRASTEDYVSEVHDPEEDDEDEDE